VLPAYREPLLGLAGELLRRVQHRHHGAALARLDTEAATEEGGRTEWQVFLAAVLELVRGWAAQKVHITPLRR
jgi:hypothetical protein